MTDVSRMDKNQLQSRRAGLLDRYREFKSRNLSLDMTRGKPCPEQLDLALHMLTGVTAQNYRAADGTAEKRAITVGVTDYQSTEVTSGLSEGEQVIVSLATVTASETSQQQQPQGGMMIPGMSGPGGPPPGG